MTDMLWNFPEDEPPVGPMQIMREQGDWLVQVSKNKLSYAINARGDGVELVNDFNIVVPSLGFYSYTLIMYSQSPLSLYPGRMYSALSGAWFSVSSEGEFRDALREILGSNKARDLIQTLLSQVS